MTYKYGNIQNVWRSIEKDLQIKMDEDYPTYPTIDVWIEEQLEIMHKSLWELNLKGQEISSKKCSTIGHTKDNCRKNVSQQDICFV